MKVGIIGAGMVGSSVGFALAITGYASEVVIIDRNEPLAVAQAEDIAHAVPFMSATRVRAGQYADLDGAGIVIMAAGASQKPGETRLELLGRNTEVFRQIVGQVLDVVSNPILLVASNPVDAITFITQRLSGLPPQRVIGSGTVLDTARFRSLIARHLSISPQSIHADVIGEHGDSEVLVWHSARASSVNLLSFAEQIGAPLTAEVRAEIDDNVRNAAYKIIAGKGATYYGIGAGIARIVRAIARDEGAVLTVSLVTDHVAGVEQVALSLPRVIGANGVAVDMPPDLSAAEHKALQHSAELLKSITDALTL